MGAITPVFKNCRNFMVLFAFFLIYIVMGCPFLRSREGQVSRMRKKRARRKKWPGSSYAAAVLPSACLGIGLFALPAMINPTFSSYHDAAMLSGNVTVTESVYPFSSSIVSCFSSRAEPGQALSQFQDRGVAASVYMGNEEMADRQEYSCILNTEGNGPMGTVTDEVYGENGFLGQLRLRWGRIAE
ncbi:MAG: hypothetical protein K0Q90_2328 [Paenibacillaceae bacterium]|jgi:hypothetical protein|nr:hypothetical protein [Paenibacillaceae bacterium]